MINGKNAQHIVLNESQMIGLISYSVRNVVDLQIQSGTKVHNNFKIMLVLDCVIPEIFPEHSMEGIEATDYDKEIVFESHLVEPLVPFSTSVFRVNDNSTKQKFWGVELIVNQKNIRDFIQALGEIENEWNEVDAMDESLKEPTEGSILIKGNETLN
jgi:hypothetical protein